MKLRNFLIVLFAILMVFAFASCKNEPKEEPKPTPKPQPVIPDYYQIEVTEGVDKDYWNRDKIKIEWEEEVNAGDVVSLKYRSERDVYQWDIRDGNLKWVYEKKKGSFTDPVLGEDGWWTLTYTFANDINGAAVDSNERFGIYFRGNYVTTDIFEIKDITLNGEPLEITQDNIKSYAVLNGTDENPIVEHDWSKKNWSVLFATGTVGEVDRTPLAEKVLDGGLVTGAPVNKEGYTLSIFTDAERTTAFDATQPITENKIFYYSYVGVPRALTFVLNGGAFEEGAEVPATVPNGDMLPEIPEPVLATKAFKAWYKDAELTTPWEATDTVLGDLTLYAAYGEPATVTFDAQNGEETHVTKLVAIGNPVKMPETPEKELHMFLGWYTDAEGTTLYDFSTPVTADITVYAKWALPANVTLNLNYAEAGEPEVVQVALNTAMEEPEAPSRTGFIFEGWYTTAECTTAYNFALPVSADIAIYAKWSEGTIYKIVATKGDGSTSWDKFVLDWQNAGVYVKLNDVLAFRYRTTEPFTKFNIRGANKWVYETGSSTLTSYSEDADGWITVSYKFGEKYYDGTTAVPYGETGLPFRFDFISNKIRPGDVLEVKGITLNGVELELVKVDYNATEFTVIEAEDDWTAKHSVTFDYGEGDERTNTVSNLAYGTAVELPADTVKAGLSFIGWYTDSEFQNKFDASNKLTADLTLYGLWLEPAKVTIHNGAESSVKEVAKGATLSASDIQIGKAGYFVEWYANDGLTTPFDFTAAIDADTDIYAKWVAPTEAYQFTSTVADTRWQFRWHEDTIELLNGKIDAGDVFTLMLKFPEGNTLAENYWRLRVRSGEAHITENTSFSSTTKEGDWYVISVTVPNTIEAGKGLYLQIYGAGEANWPVGSVMIIKGLAINGQEIAIDARDYGTASTHKGAYEKICPNGAVIAP